MADNLQQWHGGLVDPTLTKESVPAEAKATGTAIEAVQKALKELEETGISSDSIETAIREYLEANPIEGVTNRELEQAVETALQEAKDSGEFKGDPGDPGPAGKDGKDGNDGERGEKGTTFTPSVSEDGTLSWSNDGGLANPDPVNITGPMPVKGTDYWTEADKQEILNDIAESDNIVAANANQLNGKGAEFYATAEAVNRLSNEYTKVTIVSDEFDTEKNYNPGDYCISDNKLWRCRIASQGVVPSDDSSEWIQCNIAGEIQNYIVLNTYEFPNSNVGGEGSNMFDVTMNGYTPIAISYAMTNFVGCDIVGTRLYGNNVDLRFSQSQSGIIVRFGVLYKKS